MFRYQLLVGSQRIVDTSICSTLGDLRKHDVLDLSRLQGIRHEMWNIQQRSAEAPWQDFHVHGITRPLGHLIHDSDPGLCSKSFWFKIASWPWKFAPLSPLSDPVAMRAVWTVLFFVVAVALRPECLCQIQKDPKERDAAPCVFVCLVLAAGYRLDWRISRSIHGS